VFLLINYRYCTVGTFISVFKDNKSLRSHKTVEPVKVFLKILLPDARGSGSVKLITDPDSGGPKTSGSGTQGKTIGQNNNKKLKNYHICARTIGGRFDCMKKPLACTPVINLGGEIFL
jgi:hypothetical protein